MSGDLSNVMQAERERVEKLLAEIWYDKDRFDAIVKFAVDQVERGRALLPEPVDADLVEARSIIADAFRDYSGDESDDNARLVEEGKMDDAGSVKRIVDLAHRLRTRVLERDSREG